MAPTEAIYLWLEEQESRLPKLRESEEILYFEKITLLS